MVVKMCGALTRGRRRAPFPARPSPTADRLKRQRLADLERGHEVFQVQSVVAQNARRAARLSPLGV
jgi:hypothetical protein